MRELPIGIQSFDRLRKGNYLYVDKTAKLLDLVLRGERYFLSRPRRFGKSLTLSTFEAMFRGRTELFAGLFAEKWVKEYSKNSSPVLRFDLSGLDSKTPQLLHKSLIETIKRIGSDFNVEIKSETLNGMFTDLLYGIYKLCGSIVILIDEYDKPILDNINNLEKANEMREVLRSFYSTLKSCDECLRFVFITGISKFSKAGVFSAMNNLEDISMDEHYGDITGYTQLELEENFSEWINNVSVKMKIERQELLKKLKEYYDGFSFDGNFKLYNPFSIMQCFKKAKLSNYWYLSGSATFIVEYMKSHLISDPEVYRHFEVPADFSDSYEIEKSKPESFLYQSGYLTIEKWNEDVIKLDYPNIEVLKSITRMYLEGIYHVESYITLGNEIWQTLSSGNIEKGIFYYNIALAGIPYEDFSKRDEYWYRSLFLMLLRGAGITAFGEIHTHKGRSDLLIKFSNLIIILEFKFANKSSEIEKKKFEGDNQILDRDYAKAYEAQNFKIITAVIIADDERHQVIVACN